MIRFVTGTDTGVGKTVVSAALLQRANERGMAAAYYKPVQTGLSPGQAGDADYVGSVADVPTHEGVRLREPLAPTVAATLEGVELDGVALIETARDLSKGLDLLVVEGAGGLLVPLAPDLDMADCAKALDAQLVVVVRPVLGTLNHTALTVEAAVRRGLAVEGIVISGWPSQPGTLERTNWAELSKMAPVIGVIAHDDAIDTESAVVTRPRWISPGDMPSP